MVRKKNLVILIIILIIVVPVAYFGISSYLHELEEKNFYESLLAASDLENHTDAAGDKVRNKSAPSVEELKEFELDAINTISAEILLLQDLKANVSNQSYIDFLDIQLNRLNSENRTYTAMLDNANTYEQYKAGKIASSRALSLINDKNQEISIYSNKTADYKAEADSFLSTHTDMKERFNQLGIDEDFLFNQIEEVKASRVV